MKQRHKQIRPDGVCVSDVPALRFICSSNLYAGHEMDVRDLQFADGTDVAVDKGNRPYGRLVSCREQILIAQRHDGCHDDRRRQRMGE